MSDIKEMIVKSIFLKNIFVKTLTRFVFEKYNKGYNFFYNSYTDFPKKFYQITIVLL